MAGKGTKVSVGLEVDVTGTKDVDTLARSIDAAGKAAKDDVKLRAEVTGTKDVATLVDTLDDVPTAPVDTKVSATVTGDDKVDILAADIDRLPASTSTTVAATVTGDDKVDILAADIHGLPASTSATVTASVAGGTDIDTLAQDIADLPARKDVSVSVSASSPPGKGLKDVGTDIDNVKGKAGDLAVEGSAFGSQFLGSYSEGAGLFGDLAEQLSNLKRSADETGGSVGGGGFKGILSIAGGLGAGIIGGLLIDQVLGAFTQLEESQTAVKEAVEATSQALIDNGGFWSQAAALAATAAIEGSDVFKELTGSGVSYSAAMEAMTSGAESVNKVNAIMAGQGKSLGIMAQKEVASLANVESASKDAAKEKYAYLKANNLLTESQKKAEASNKGAANGLDLTGDAARHAGDETDFATGRVKAFNNTPVKDKKATVDVTDKATPKVDAVNKKDLHDKDSTLKATDQATPKVDAVNRKPLADKKSYLTVSDLATPPLNTFNRTPISDKSATVDANTDPAQAKIDLLDGQKVKVDVDLLVTDNKKAAFFGIPNGSTLSAPAPSSSSTRAPAALRSSVHVGGVTAPSIQVNVTGALDPAAVARQIQQVLTRADRRTNPLRAGSGNLRAPV